MQSQQVSNTPIKPQLSPTCQNCIIKDKSLAEDLKHFIMDDCSPIITFSHQSTKCPPFSSSHLNYEENLQTDVQIKQIVKPKPIKPKPQQRKDKFGNKILKGDKKHKICFAPILAEEFEIENWKPFNKKGIQDVESCYCNVF